MNTATDFWKMVETDFGHVCWPYQGPINERGYGKLIWCGKQRQAHHVAYELAHGMMPVGGTLRRSCKKPSCCNPAHMSLHVSNHPPGRSAPWGTGNGNAKLQPTDIINIRRAVREKATLRSQAQKYGISDTHVSQIAKGKAWKHVQEER